jgi:transposase-like protein
VLKIAGVFGFRKRRYRCGDCRTRFWDLPARPARQAHPKSSTSYPVDRELENPAPRM